MTSPPSLVSLTALGNAVSALSIIVGSVIGIAGPLFVARAYVRRMRRPVAPDRRERMRRLAMRLGVAELTLGGSLACLGLSTLDPGPPGKVLLGVVAWGGMIAVVWIATVTARAFVAERRPPPEEVSWSCPCAQR